MKYLLLPLIALFATLLVFSCNKNTISREAVEESASVIQAVSFEKVISSSDWQALGWKQKKEGGSAFYSTIIKDSRITPEVVSDGMILVYKKNEAPATFPSMDESGTNFSYNSYYQAQEGRLTIAYHGAATATASPASQYKYFIVSPSELQRLEGQGNSRVELMNLSYHNAAAVLSQIH